VVGFTTGSRAEAPEKRRSVIRKHDDYDINNKHLVHTSKKTQIVSITTVTLLMLFKETITVYSKNFTKHGKKLYGPKAELLILKQVVYIVTTGL
jgi:hypothetical protein